MDYMKRLREFAAQIDAADALVFGGLAAVTIGAGQIYTPLAWIIPGAASIAIGLKMGSA